MRKFQLLFATFLSFLLLNELEIDFSARDAQPWLSFNAIAEARRTGGRTRGGSFNRSTPSRPSRSSPSRSNPSRSTTPSRSNPSRSTTPSRSTPNQTTPSRGNTGGRVRGGSFQRQPSPAPAPATPTNTNRGTTSTPTTPASQPSRGSGNNTIVVPVPVPIPQPAPQPTYPAPRYDERPYEESTESGLKPAPVVPPSSESGVSSPSVTQPTTQPVQTAPQSGYSSAQTRSSGGFPWGFLLFLLILGGAVAAVWYAISKRNASPSAAQELDNDIVTVSKLQVALLASARDIQSELTDLSLSADLDTPEGLAELLQASALALLRHPDYWTHVYASSETVNSREEAARVFEQISVAERTKFSAETLTNVGGRVRYGNTGGNDEDSDSAYYIVVTLAIGTEDDKPLFDQIHSAEELQQVLQQVAAITPDYLLVFELLWSPQDPNDSLSYDDLLTHYSEMIQIG